MSAASGVPPWARPVLEALENLACGYIGPDWRAVKDACTAALAADAGTPEGERVEGWTGKPGPCPNCGAIRNERDAHFCSSTRSAPAPLAESGAAAPGPEGPVAFGDAELDRLISEYGRAHARAMERMSWPNDTPQCRAAIHAHVERMKREAHEERLRDMDVPTRHRVPERATDATPGATWSHVREMHADALAALRSVGPPNCDQPDAGGGLYYPLLFLLAAVEAHERAIMIGLMAIVEESVPAPAPTPGDTSEAAFRDALHLPETSHVDLVRRRDKEGVCE